MTLNTNNPNFAKCCSYHGNRMLFSGYVQDFADFDIVIRLILLIIEYVFNIRRDTT